MTLQTLAISKATTRLLTALVLMVVSGVVGNSTADAQTRSIKPAGSAKALFGEEGSDAEGLFPNFSLGGLKADKSVDPVVWGARYTPLAIADDGGITGTVQVVAKMSSSWHIYSTTQPKGGPLKTTITLKSPAGVKATAAAKPDREPARSVSTVYNGLTVEEFDDKVTWTIPFRGPANLDGPIEVSVRGLVCTSVDGRCMPTSETLMAKPTQSLSANTPATSSALTDKTGGNKTGANTTGVGSPETVFRDGNYAVEWTTSIEPVSVRPGETAVMKITAKPDKPYHVYQAVADATMFSTNFVVTEKSGLKLGAPQTDAKVVSEVISPSMPPIVYHAGNVTWNIPIVVPADATAGSKSLTGMISYLACTGGQCLMPKGLQWKAELNVGASPSTPSNAITMTSIKSRDVLDAADSTVWVDDLGALSATATEPLPPVAQSNDDANNGKLSTDNLLAGGASAANAGNPLNEPSGTANGASPTVSSDETASLNGEPISPTVLESSSQNMSFVTMLLFGFLGGIVLNIMPCVLPVIGLKVMSFINQAGEDRKRVLTLNLAYVAGIFLVFGILASLATFLGFGWGEQFQNFGVRLAAIVGLFAFALSYLGVWEIPAPGMASSKASQELQSKEGIAGAFSKGIFATILATPCSAPLLGSVFSALLGAPAITVFAVFFSIAAGMSFPYVIIGFVPAAAKFLPKPGAWMETFKELMAFVMLGAVAFFFYQFADTDKLAVFITLLGVWFGCWIIGKVPAWETPQKRLLALAGGIIASVAIGWFGFNGIQKEHELDWVDYSDVTLEKYQQQGRTVMVDFSAKWCVNCLVNLENAIDTPDVAELVDRFDAVAVYADWTDSNPEITRKLNELESNSIPVLAIYPGGRPDRPIVLRDLITESDVINALKQAGPSVSPVLSRVDSAKSRLAQAKDH